MRPLTTEQLVAMSPPSKTLSNALTLELEANGFIYVYPEIGELHFRLTVRGEMALRVHSAFLSSVSDGVRIS